MQDCVRPACIGTHRAPIAAGLVRGGASHSVFRWHGHRRCATGLAHNATRAPPLSVCVCVFAPVAAFMAP